MTSIINPIKKRHTSRPRMRDCAFNLVGSAVQIVNDPQQLFSAGAVFVKEENNYMLKMNCYSVGTILKDANGQKYIVEQGKRHQLMIRIGEI